MKSVIDVAALTAGVVVAGVWLSGPQQPELHWYELTFPRATEAGDVLGLLRAFPGERHGPYVVFEAIGHNREVPYRLGVEGRHAAAVLGLVTCPRNSLVAGVMYRG